MSVRFQHNDELILFASLLFYDYPKAQTLLLDRYSSIDSFQNNYRDFIQGLRIGLKRQSVYYDRIKSIDIESQFKLIQQHCDGIIRFTDNHYPCALKQLYDPPICLYYKGDPSLLSKPSLSVVGTRKANAYGHQLNSLFCQFLSPHLTICSGLALGIDGIAHDTTLKNNGNTIAFLGTGIDLCYPSTHKALFKRICEEGLVITEFPCAHPVKPAHFPQRNRLITGISLGTLLIQAQLKSGSMISANLARDSHKPVFVIPHSITDPLGDGGHHLLKEGAYCVTHPNDILQILSLNMSFTHSNESSLEPPLLSIKHPPPDLTSDEARLWSSLSTTPKSTDELQQASGIELSKMLQLLTLMELKEYITLLPGAKVKKGEHYD